MPIIIAKDQVREPLWAVVPYHNPQRLKSRDKHTERAIKHFHDSGATVVLVEAAFNRRELVFADSGLDGMLANCNIPNGAGRHKYIGLHTKDESWIKEQLINIGVQNLPYDWQNMCFLDSDVTFIRPNWVGECIHKLQHGTSSDICWLQMFSQARDLAPNYEMLPADYPHAQGLGFVEAWRQGIISSSDPEVIKQDLKNIRRDIKQLGKDVLKLEEDLFGNYYGTCPTSRVFPGLAWAVSRRGWDSVGGLIDIAIWGGADWHMSHALIEKTEGMMLESLHPNYKAIVNEWANRCKRHVRKNVLVMEGAIFHSWHGRKVQRAYNEKHKLLAKFGFDPLAHLKRDAAGIYQLHDDGSDTFTNIRDTMRKISKSRNEDSIDI